jgi:hypothetical protein
METENGKRLKGWRRPDAAAGEGAWTSAAPKIGLRVKR